MNKWLLLGVLLFSGCDGLGLIGDGFPEAVVHGTVKTEEGEPVAGAEISVIAHETDCSDDGELANPYNGPALTDASGKFSDRFLLSMGPAGITVHSACTEIRVAAPAGSFLHGDTVFAGPLLFGRTWEDSLAVEILLPARALEVLARRVASLETLDAMGPPLVMKGGIWVR